MPPALGKAAAAVAVVDVKTPSLVAISTPSNVLFVVMAPVIAPPDFGKAALAVVVVEVNIASLVAMSTPSIVELVVKAPVKAPPVVARNVCL